MNSWTSYGPSFVPDSIGTGFDYGVRFSAQNLLNTYKERARSTGGSPRGRGFPPAAAAPADGNQAGEDRDGDLGGRDSAQVEADGALDAGDDLLGHPLSQKCL